MLVFHDHQATFTAKELPERKPGELTVFTEIRIKGVAIAVVVPLLERFLG